MITPSLALLVGATWVGAAQKDAYAYAPSDNNYTKWITECDSLSSCAAYDIRATGGEGGYDTWVALGVERDAGPNALPRFRLEANLGDDGLPSRAHLTFEKGPSLDANLENGAVDLGKLAGASVILQALGQAKWVTIAFDGEPAFTMSLDGAVSAMREMDEKQGRVDTASALVSPNPQATKMAPPVPTLPTILAARPINAKPIVDPAMPPAIAALPQAETCLGAQKNPEDPREKRLVYRLDKRRTLWRILCWTGAGKDGYLFVVYDTARKQAHLADFEGTSASDQDRALLVDGEFDTKTMFLRAGSGERPPDSCGRLEEYVWDGARFRLVSVSSGIGEVGPCSTSIVKKVRYPDVLAKAHKRVK